MKFWNDIWPENWPEEVPKLEPHTHTLYRHDFMFAVVSHDIACPVCFENHAIFQCNNGQAMPCRKCTNAGWKIAKLPKWFWRLLGQSD